MEKRNTYKYILKDGNKIKYVGITDDPQRRESEHKRDRISRKWKLLGVPSHVSPLKNGRLSALTNTGETITGKFHHLTKHKMANKSVCHSSFLSSNREQTLNYK